MTRITLWAVLVVAPAAPAIAQERKWDIEVFGGAVLGTTGGDGTRTLPPAGLPIVTSTPIFPSREVSSWFFGDGPVLLNDVNEQFGTAGRITPLDPFLVAGEAGGGGVFGARLRRRVSDRFSAEFSFDGFAGFAIRHAEKAREHLVGSDRIAVARQGFGMRAAGNHFAVDQHAVAVENDEIKIHLSSSSGTQYSSRR
jgi:hypothetical protein